MRRGKGEEKGDRDRERETEGKQREGKERRRLEKPCGQIIEAEAGREQRK